MSELPRTSGGTAHGSAVGGAQLGAQAAWPRCISAPNPASSALLLKEEANGDARTPIMLRGGDSVTKANAGAGGLEPCSCRLPGTAALIYDRD